MTKKQLIELWNSLDDDTEIEYNIRFILKIIISYKII